MNRVISYHVKKKPVEQQNYLQEYKVYFNYPSDFSLRFGKSEVTLLIRFLLS
jgi:hypothetical protein